MTHKPSFDTAKGNVSDEIIELLQQLVRIPSVNPDLDERGTGEAHIADFAAEWLHRRGVATTIEFAAPGRPNVVATIGSGSGRSLALCAHLDTVSAAGMTIDPFDPVIKDRRLFGRGSYDMKGGAASIMAAAAVLAAEDLSGTVQIALVADEEYKSIGAADFVRGHAADACIITEPSELAMVLAHKGFLWFEIETEGRAAHGSRWDLGESAIGKMGPIITALDRLDRDVLRRRTHELTGPASLHCAVVDGGEGWSTYARRCVLRVERRTIPGESPEDVRAEFEEVVRSADADAEVRVVFERSPSTCDPGEPVARSVREAAAEVLGEAPEETGVAYWMDAAIFTEAGVPTVNIGPSGDGAHAAEEWVDVDSVITCAEILIRAARTFTSEKQQ